MPSAEPVPPDAAVPADRGRSPRLGGPQRARGARTGPDPTVRLGPSDTRSTAVTLLCWPEVLCEREKPRQRASRSSGSWSRSSRRFARSVKSSSCLTRSISAASASTIPAFTLVPRTRATTSACSASCSGSRIRPTATPDVQSGARRSAAHLDPVSACEGRYHESAWQRLFRPDAAAADHSTGGEASSDCRDTVHKGGRRRRPPRCCPGPGGGGDPRAACKEAVWPPTCHCPGPIPSLGAVAAVQVFI